MKKFTLFYQVLLAVVVGVFMGLFFGPLTSFLKPIAEVFRGLVHMAFLPLVAFSIMQGIGSLDRQKAWSLLGKIFSNLIFLWILIFGAVFLVSIYIPTALSTIVEHELSPTQESRELLSTIFSENPFYNFINNVVIATALFSLILGIAIMTLHHKEPLLGFLDNSCFALEKILFWLAKFSPVAIFVIVGYQIGNADFHLIWKLRFLLLSALAVVLFFLFIIFPVLIHAITPQSSRSLFKEFYRVGTIAFLTGEPAIAFPFLMRSLRKYAQKNMVASGDYQPVSRAVIPIGFGFGQIGNAFTLVFLLFFAYYFRNPLLGADKIFLSLAMIPFSFGASAMTGEAIYFLLASIGFSDQAGDIYSAIFPITQHLQSLLTVSAIFVLALLSVTFYYGFFKTKIRYLLWKIGLIYLSVGLLMFLTQGQIKMHDYYKHLFVKFRVQDVLENPVKSVLIKPREDWDLYKNEHGKSIASDPLQRILETGVLRVGYDPRMVPFCYWNENGELTGYDIAFAYQLARDLDCVLELRPIVLEELALQLTTGYYDIAMSGLIMDESRLPFMLFSDSYAEQNNVLVVPYTKRNDFKNLSSVTSDPKITIGAIGEYNEIAPRHFSDNRIIRIHSMEPLIKGQVNAVMWAKYDGFVWCLQHPNFVVVEYGGLIGKQFFAYPVNIHAPVWQAFVNSWLYLKDQSGFTMQQRDYWFEGKVPKTPEERWSILSSILQRVEKDG
jgi:proton glutamate symport protein